MPSRSALVAGASGLVGGHCLRLLLRHPEYERVYAVVRRPLGFTDLKLTEVSMDDLPPVTDVFCSLGTTLKRAGSKEAFRKIDYELPRNLAARGASQGARRLLLVSSVDAALNSPSFYLRVKAELEEAVIAMPFESVDIFRPSLLIGERSESRVAEAISIPIARGLQFVLRGRWRKYRAIPAEAVASAMVRTALLGAPGRHVHHYDDMIGLS